MNDPQTPKPPPKDFTKGENRQYKFFYFLWPFEVIAGVLILVLWDDLMMKIVGGIFLVSSMVVTPIRVYQRWKEKTERLIGEQKPPVP